jgi:hypothetical protein
MAVIKNGWHDTLCVQLLFIKDYKLRGNQIILCALMHKYDSVDIKMMQKWTGATKQGVIKTINSLIELGIAKKEYYVDENNNKRTKYMLNVEE